MLVKIYRYYLVLLLLSLDDGETEAEGVNSFGLYLAIVQAGAGPTMPVVSSISIQPLNYSNPENYTHPETIQTVARRLSAQAYAPTPGLTCIYSI